MTKTFWWKLLVDLPMGRSPHACFVGVSSNSSSRHLKYLYFPGGSDGKVSAFNAGNLGSIPGLGRSPGGGNGHPL